MSKIGLILSGGMAKGAYQIGALQAIGEFIKPDDFTYFSAASIGVLNTYAFITKTMEKARDAWHSVSHNDSAVWVTDILRSSLLQHSIKNLISDHDTITKDFYFPLFNFTKRNLNYYNFRSIPPEEVQNYLSASVAVPYYNKACVVNNEKYYDGAIVDNIPVYPLLKHDYDYLICIYFNDYNTIFENESTDRRIIKLTFPDRTVLSNSMLVRKESVDCMIKEGYKQTKATLDFVFYRGIDDVDYILERIEDLNRTYTQKRQIRLTVDVVISNLNKVTRRFAEKSVSE
ncbi:MAG: patatin-like phospholipase family protein [Eubacteriales bacterium]